MLKPITGEGELNCHISRHASYLPHKFIHVFFADTFGSASELKTLTFLVSSSLLKTGLPQLYFLQQKHREMMWFQNSSYATLRYDASQWFLSFQGISFCFPKVCPTCVLQTLISRIAWPWKLGTHCTGHGTFGLLRKIAASLLSLSVSVSMKSDSNRTGASGLIRWKIHLDFFRSFGRFMALQCNLVKLILAKRHDLSMLKDVESLGKQMMVQSERNIEK